MATKDQKNRENTVSSDQSSIEKKESEDTLNGHIDPDIKQVLDNFPNNEQKSIMAMMQYSGPKPNPLLDKIDSDHIHKLLDYTREEGKSAHRMRSSNRWFQLAYTLLAISAGALMIIYLLPLDKQLLVDILKVLVGFAGGLGSGLGLKSYWNKK